VALACWVGYSYSSYYYGSTNNAANNGLSWSMDTVLPQYNNLTVNGVFYTYTPIKERADAMKVHVQNENPNGGYIFRQTDDWSGKSGGIPIVKTIGLEYIPKELWGNGSIDVEGTGSVENARVVYSYRYDNSCTTPLDSPTCDGYADAVLNLVPESTVIEIYNALEDENIKEEKSDVEYEEENKKENEQNKEEEIERALAINKDILKFGNNLIQNQLLSQMNNAINMNSYYQQTINGGVYKETIVLKDKKLPDNKRGARMGLATQILHDKMVDMQYNRGE